MPRDRTHVIESVTECRYPAWTVYTVRYTGGAVRKYDTSQHRLPKTLFDFIANPRVSSRCVMMNVNEYTMLSGGDSYGEL